MRSYDRNFNEKRVPIYAQINPLKLATILRFLSKRLGQRYFTRNELMNHVVDILADTLIRDGVEEGVFAMEEAMDVFAEAEISFRKDERARRKVSKILTAERLVLAKHEEELDEIEEDYRRAIARDKAMAAVQSDAGKAEAEKAIKNAYNIVADPQTQALTQQRQKLVEQEEIKKKEDEEREQRMLKLTQQHLVGGDSVGKELLREMQKGEDDD